MSFENGTCYHSVKNLRNLDLLQQYIDCRLEEGSRLQPKTDFIVKKFGKNRTFYWLWLEAKGRVFFSFFKMGYVLKAWIHFSFYCDIDRREEKDAFLNWDEVAFICI